MTISVRHEAKDRFRIRIRGHEVVVDQPAPASDDAGPTPTELLVASLAACAGFCAHRFLARHGLADGDLAISCDFAWAPDRSRVSSIGVIAHVGPDVTPELEAGLLRAIDRCTVQASIRAAPTVTVTCEVAARDVSPVGA